MSRRILFSLLLLCLLPASAIAQDVDPRGMYFNRFTGGFDGTEWFQVTQKGTGNVYQLRDIYGGGFTGTIDADGNISIGNFPPGMFSNLDDFIIFPVLGGTSFTFDCNRVPTTTPDFPLRLFSPRPANSLLNGQWNNTLRFINPETGVPGNPGTEIITITTNGNTVRITDPGGLFFQGVFEDGLNAAFRVVNNPFFGNATGIFATFPGSSTNIGQDLNGEMNMININEFRASFLLQTRQQLGNQTQSLVEFEATRVNPIACGDANGDGVVDTLDNAIVDFLQGISFESDSYNLAADFNGDGVIDTVDLAKTCTSGDTNLDGEVNLLDVAPFVAFLTSGFYFCEADVNQDGSIDLLDVQPFVDLLAGG